MHIIKTKVCDCTEFDIVAEDIVNSKGLVILARGTIITNYIKKRLIEIGIENINIYTSLNDSNNFANKLSYQNSKRQYRETILLVKKIINDLACGKKLQYDKVKSVSNIILKLANEKRNVINYLNDVRNIDEYTYNHCVNVAFYSMLISIWLGLSPKETNDIIQAGLLHDIGKTKIPDKIINKKGKLTDEEFDIIKSHTILGYEILSQIDDINYEIRNTALLHHERTDGSGYPFNASVDAIGLYAKIVAIADVFDAMTSDRVYKKKRTPFDVFEMFKIMGVGIFDTHILNTFIKNISPYYIGTNVILNNGQKGRIVYVPPQDILSPVIEIKSDYIDLSIQNNIKIISVN